MSGERSLTVYSVGEALLQKPDYERIFRRLHPTSCPASPGEHQRELRDLWPADQQKFRDEIDIILRSARP